MLSNVEAALVRLFRWIVATTAFVSILITAGALLYAGYAAFAPDPHANLSGHIESLRQATDPVNLIKSTFPSDSTVYKEAFSTSDNVRYERNHPSDGMIFTEFNNFLDIALGASFESQKQFSDWLYGSGKIQFSWDKSIDDESATDDNNVNLLWRSLIIDYAKRLSFRATSLGAARKQKLYPTSFDRFTAPTGQARAPYFLAWFFSTLEHELQSIDRELDSAKAQRVAMRLTIPLALETASGAFAYFFAMMLLFLFVSIEASARYVAGGRRVVTEPQTESHTPPHAPPPPSPT